MAVIDVSDCNVYIATSATGPFTALPEATGYSFQSDSEGESTIRTFGGGKHVRAGDDNDTYDLSALFDPAGQKTMRDAKREKTPIWIALIHDDTPGAEAGSLQKCRVTSYSHNGEAEGDFVRASFNAAGEGALTEITKLPTSGG